MTAAQPPRAGLSLRACARHDAPGIRVSHAPSQRSGFPDTGIGQGAQDHAVAEPANPGGLHDDGDLVHLPICTDLAHMPK